MIYISIGSNIGNRLNNIQKAISLLRARFFSNLKLSIILETEAILPSGAPLEWNKPYLNMVVQAESSISPPKLLAGLKDIEREIGRKDVYEKWSPRLIDLDILLWDKQTINTPQLIIPHPELFNRSFLIHLIALLNPEYRFSSSNENLYNGKTFGEIAYSISNINICYHQSLVASPKLVGIVNITPDSFSDGGVNFSAEAAITRAKQLMLEGATVVELGPQSTRPGAVVVDSVVEYSRLQPVLEGLLECMNNKEISISLDTFLPSTILKVLKYYPISWVNDVKGDLDDKTLIKIAERGLKIVAMHSLTIPPEKDKHLSFEKPPIQYIAEWAMRKVKHLEKCGFSKNNIVIDPGIGFGKSVYQNISILKNIHQLKTFGCEILVGHSRKSYISSFYPSVAKERDLETIAISQILAKQGIDYLRIHNIKYHQRFFVAQQLIQK